MAQPDIASILAALAAQQTSIPQASSTPQQQNLQHQAPHGYPPGMLAPNAPPQAQHHLPQPTSSSTIDLNNIRPMSTSTIDLNNMRPMSTSTIDLNSIRPTSTSTLDLNSMKPASTGTFSIADAIAKARNIAADHGVTSYNSRQAAGQLHPKPPTVQETWHPARGSSSGWSRPANALARGLRLVARPMAPTPYRDERREDPRRTSYRRSPSPDRTNFRGARDPPIGYRANDGETETIRVKSSLVGLIIGRNGENLRKVETESGARVQFIQAKDSHVPERQCTISGNLRAREAAKNAIFAIIEENGGGPAQEKGAYTAGMPGRAKVNLPALREGEASTVVMVPDKTVGLIIGRGGETIKDLQERSGCHVNIVGENKSVNGLRPINLIGSERATAVAKDLIMEIVESDSRSTAANNNNAMPRDRPFDGGMGRNGGGGGGRDLIEKSINVPSEAVGMIIGKGGETIKDMQRTTGCKINVNQPQPPDVTRKIDLAGTARAMEQAEHAIWEKVETVKQRDAAGGRGQPGRDHGAPQYDAYSQPQQAQSFPSYGQYGAAGGALQAPPQVPMFQMPQSFQQPAPQAASDNAASDPLTAYYAAYYAQMAQQQQNPGNQQ